MSRRVEIRTPLGEALQFHRLIGREALSRLYRFEIDLLGQHNAIDPKALLGQGATVVMQTESGEPRHLGGIATRFALAHQDDRHAFYRLHLRPWLWLATRRSDFRIFQDKTVPEILTAVLGPYGHPVEHKLSRSYRTWEYCVQYGESDYDFFARLCEHEGIYYHFRHQAGEQVLVLGDDIAGAHAPLPGGEAVRFHPLEHSGMGRRERIYAWSLAEEVRSGHHYNDDHDFEKPKAELSHLRQMPAGHAHDHYELYEWPGGFVAHGDGETYARLRNEEQRSEGTIARGRANLRTLAPGHTLRLVGHPRADQNRQYLLLGVSYHLQENLQASEGAAADGATGGGSVQRFAFEAQPTSVPWRPARTTPRPRTRGPQTATVVGPEGEEIWCDPYGRIKVQFHWDRLGQQDEHSSCWLRVATPWAGATMGAVSVPRIGMEVLVDFLGGDPDRPIVTGCVYNAEQMPPWQLPAQKHLAGLRSRELGGGRSNHLVLDDSQGRIQAQLRSDHQASQLSVGHIGRIQDTAGRQAPRGQGFELRTDGHGALRAAKGLLVSTEARPDARAHATDLPETVARLTQARALHEGLGEAARAAGAHAAGDQDEVTQALKAQNDAIRGSGGNAAQGEFPEFQQPHLTLASPAGIQSTAEGSTHIVSNEHTALTSGGHASLSAGKSLLVSAHNAVRMFAYKAGMRLVSAQAPVDIQALKHSVNLLAKMNIRLEANRITISAREEVMITGGSSYTRWSASGIESGTNGLWREHAASHSLVGPDNKPGPVLREPSVVLKETPAETEIAYSTQHVPGPAPQLFAGQPYTLFKDGAEIKRGRFDEYGRLTIGKAEKGARYQVRLFNGTVHDIPVESDRMVSTPDNAEYDEQQLSNRGYRSDGDDAAKRRSQRNRGAGRAG